jgi:hypothetical protein
VGDRLGAQVVGTWLTAGVGGERIERRDQRISPARYAGVTAGLQAVGFERLSRSTLINASVEFVEGDLTSAVGGAGEHLSRTTADASLQVCARKNLFVGLQVAMRGEVVEHTYPLTPITEDFDVVVASLSPVVTWFPRLRGRPLRLRGSVAAVSLVDREYSRSKAGESDDDVSGPATWAAGVLEVSRDFRDNARVSWRVAARATAWSHRTEIGAANVETRASISGRVRLGSLR